MEEVRFATGKDLGSWVYVQYNMTWHGISTGALLLPIKEFPAPLLFPRPVAHMLEMSNGDTAARWAWGRRMAEGGREVFRVLLHRAGHFSPIFSTHCRRLGPAWLRCQVRLSSKVQLAVV